MVSPRNLEQISSGLEEAMAKHWRQFWKRDEAMNEEEKPIVRQAPPQFIPKLIGKKVIIRLVSGGQPITGTINAYNPYDILLQTAKGDILVFKQAISIIELADSPFS